MTTFEKLTWSPDDGFGLRIAETKFGRMDALICRENANPLARYSLTAEGEQVHISTLPTVSPTSAPSFSKGNEIDKTVSGKSSEKRSNYDNVAANRIGAALRCRCIENKCFGIMCTGHLDAARIEDNASESSDPSYLSQILEATLRGEKMFLDPTGAALPGHVMDPKTVELALLPHGRHQHNL